MLQNFISKLSPKEKKIFYMAVFFVLAAFLDRLFLGPAMTRLKSLDEEIEHERNIIKSDLRFLSFKNRILKENNAFSAYYAAKAQSDEEIIASFLKNIEMFASQAKVNLVKVNPSGSKQKKDYMEYYTNLECEGRLEDVAKFIYSVNTSSGLLKIIKLSINHKKAGLEYVNAAMTITKIIIDDASLKEAEKFSVATENSAVPQDAGTAASASSGKGRALAPRIASQNPSAQKTSPAEEGDPLKPSLWDKFMRKRTK